MTTTGLSVWEEQYKTIPIFLGAVWTNIQAFAGVYKKTFPLWMHLMSGIGILSIAWRSRWRNFALMLILLAVIAPNFVVNIPKSHSYLYSVFVMTFICFVSCFEAVTGSVIMIAGKLLPKVKPRFIEVFFSCILMFTISYIALGFNREANAYYVDMETEAMTTEKIYKGAGEIIRDNSQINDAIMTRWGLVGYFANRPIITLPKGGVKDVIDYGRKNGASFILIDTNSVYSRRQELIELLGPLEGKPVNPEYGIEVFNGNNFPDLGGYVIYRYKR